MNDRICVIIVAGGVGKRMGAAIPKQFLLLRNRPILMHTLERIFAGFKGFDLRVVLVLNEDYRDYWNDLKQKYGFNLPVIETNGGKERFHSVKNGLALCYDNGIIAVHDAVRPLITPDFLHKGYDLATEKGCAIPYTLPKSSLRIEENGENRPLPRWKVRVIQTPQFFDAGKLKQAYDTEYRQEFTDDASVFEAAGNKIFLYEGLDFNIKITTEADLLLAAYFIEKI